MITTQVTILQRNHTKRQMEIQASGLMAPRLREAQELIEQSVFDFASIWFHARQQIISIQMHPTDNPTPRVEQMKPNRIGIYVLVKEDDDNPIAKFEIGIWPADREDECDDPANWWIGELRKIANFWTKPGATVMLTDRSAHPDQDFIVTE